MAEGLQLETIAQTIACLEVQGLRVLGLNQIPETVMGQRLPLLMPSTNNPDFVTDLNVQRTTLRGSRTVSYTLTYKLYVAPIGGGRGLFDHYPNTVNALAGVIDALLVTGVLGMGVEHADLSNLAEIGSVSDAVGKVFHGATLSLRVTEYWSPRQEGN